MIQELLLALVGCPGDLFIDTREQDFGNSIESTRTQQNDVQSGDLFTIDELPNASKLAIPLESTYCIAPDITFIRESERLVIERLLKLGFYYSELDKFITKSQQLSWSQHSKTSGVTLGRIPSRTTKQTPGQASGQTSGQTSGQPQGQYRGQTPLSSVFKGANADGSRQRAGRTDQGRRGGSLGGLREQEGEEEGQDAEDHAIASIESSEHGGRQQAHARDPASIGEPDHLHLNRHDLEQAKLRGGRQEENVHQHSLSHSQRQTQGQGETWSRSRSPSQGEGEQEEVQEQEHEREQEREQELEQEQEQEQEGYHSEASAYRRAMADGLLEALSAYAQTVLQVEHRVQCEPVPVLTFLTRAFQQYELLLPALHHLAWRVSAQRLRGGALLDLLYSHAHTGLPSLRACIERIMWHCHQVTLRQLAPWLTHGLVVDPHREFFICRQGDNPPGGTSDEGEGSADVSQWESAMCLREDMLPAYLPLPLGKSILFVGNAVHVLRQYCAKQASGRNTAGEHMPRAKEGATAGVGAPDQVAGCEAQDPRELERDFRAIASLVAALQGRADVSIGALERAVAEAHTIAAHHLWHLMVHKADLAGHLRALKSSFLLAKGEFFQSFLEESRELMSVPPRASSAEFDLQSPFDKAKLNTATEGEERMFSRLTFRLSGPGPPLSKHTQPLASSHNKRPGGRAAPAASSSSSLLHVPSTSVDSHRTPQVAMQGRGKIGRGVPPGGAPGHDDVAGAGASHMEDGWDHLSLEYRVEWPLQLLLTPLSFSKYNLIFQHLIGLKRVQLALERAWSSAMCAHAAALRNDRWRRKETKAKEHALVAPPDKTARARGDEAPEGTKERERERQEARVLWCLLQRMKFFVANFQFYLQVDVIESQFAVLEQKLATSSQFSHLALAHSEFLAALGAQAFLDMGSVQRIVRRLRATCWSLAHAIAAHRGAPPLDVLLTLSQDFSTESRMLYILLRSSRLTTSARAPFLRQLLLRLNFNDFLEVAARDALTAASRTSLP